MQSGSSDLSGTAAGSPERPGRERAAVLAVWLALTAILFGLGGENTFLPGLYYDEAVFGGLAKDFVTGAAHGRHMPNTETIEVFGHPFPVFVQSYLGAVKSWALIPPVACFGSSVPVLRLTNLAWSAAGLLFFMLWSWRVAGLGVALAAGALLALDPAFFFTGVLDWGAAVPSLFFRFAGFFFAVRAWEQGKARDALLAGLCFGLGLFNKIDFAILLVGAGLGAAAALARPLAAFVAQRRALLAWGGLGFIVGGGLMLLHAPKILGKHAPAQPGELNEKFHVLQMMWDGSYFYRLMEVGGRFETMHGAATAAWTPFGLVLAVSVLTLAAGMFRQNGERAAWRLRVFLVLTLLFVTVGFLWLPGAVRLHHSLLVLPFPHLIIATALIGGWNRWSDRGLAARMARGLFAGIFVVLLGWQTAAILQTQRLIRETGGRGCWSEAMVQFCREVKGRSDLVIISLDWGFNEQLLYLTDGPRMEEPIWNWIADRAAERAKPPTDPNLIYLFHPEQYSKFSYGSEFARIAPPPGKQLSIQTWRDAQGKPAFYAARFLTNGPAP